MMSQEMYLAMLILGVMLLLISFIILKFCSKQYRNNLIDFIDSSNNITVLSKADKITAINKSGLEFFGFRTLEHLLQENSSISDFFIEKEGCVNKYTYGKKWLEYLSKTSDKNLKVKMYSDYDDMQQFFHIKVSKMKHGSEYLISFSNISELEKEKEYIRSQADHDALTNIYNRVKFNSVYPAVVDRALRHDEAFSIILFDIDYFKSINDTYGHNAGDKVLVELARLVNLGLRESDIFARWGGEEFVILSRYSTAHQAQLLASRLRKDIESYSFDIVKKMTCSFGVTQFKADDSKAQLFNRVDDALYEAKDNGRNQVVLK